MWLLWFNLKFHNTRIIRLNDKIYLSCKYSYENKLTQFLSHTRLSNDCRNGRWGNVYGLPSTMFICLPVWVWVIISLWLCSKECVHVCLCVLVCGIKVCVYWRSNKIVEKSNQNLPAVLSSPLKIKPTIDLHELVIFSHNQTLIKWGRV